MVRTYVSKVLTSLQVKVGEDMRLNLTGLEPKVFCIEGRKRPETLQLSYS